MQLRWVSFLAPNMYPVYSFVARAVGRRLGVSTEIAAGRSFAAFASGDADVGFICGLPYVELSRLDPPPIELLGAPILSGRRYGGRPIYFSDVIVAASSDVRSFEDLAGRSWAYNEPHSHSGYNLTRYRLATMGVTSGFFGKVVEAGYHQLAIRLVAEGAVDASAIDSQVLEIELRDHPELVEQVKVVDVLGPSTIQPVVAAARLDRGLKRDLTTVLLGLAEEQGARAALATGFVERFVRMTDVDYDDIRAMLAAAELVGPLLDPTDETRLRHPATG